MWIPKRRGTRSRTTEEYNANRMSIKRSSRAQDGEHCRRHYRLAGLCRSCLVTCLKMAGSSSLEGRLVPSNSRRHIYGQIVGACPRLLPFPCSGDPRGHGNPETFPLRSYRSTRRRCRDGFRAASVSESKNSSRPLSTPARWLLRWYNGNICSLQAVSRPDHRASATYRSKSGRGGAPAEYENCKTNIRARRCLGWRPEQHQPAPLSSYKDKKCKTRDHTCRCRQKRGASSRASCYQLARNRSYKGQMFQDKGPGKLIPAVWALC